ncbi:Zinc finger CCCH domain-containing protein 14 [Carex littledalei]|uniref:Zinc finger CCCH domain-containing protein 14 n=1 Tax=Carex littledalei TaxID=544730 RepID=A0A833RBA4_9POAL|nr:Zinc finger CCCH domain-containing protein 14 [Carex littledalei]
MESEGGGDDRTFKVNFAAEGVASLKATIEEKLKDFMGDYTDDTLVEYVIVLLRNGRRKDEAAQELHVFLGDDNLSFISWLWDHLSSNLQLYVDAEPPPPPPPAPTSKLQRGPSRDDKDKTVKRPRRDWNLSLSEDNSVEKEHQQPNETTATTTKRQKIVWEERKKERASFPLRSVVTSVLNPVDKQPDRDRDTRDTRDRDRDRKPTATSRTHRRRLPQDNSQQIKEDPPSRPAVNAPRRLLQFAVRDAVKPMRHAPLATTEPAGPSINRLRSVLSAPFPHGRDDLSEEEEEEDVKEEEEDKYRPRSVIPMPSGSSGGERSSVFDRLGRARGSMGISHAEIEKKYSSDSASDKDGYDMVEYSVAQEKEAEEEVVSKQVAAVPVSHIGSKPSKILNISVNVNTWKSPGMVQETHSFSLENNKVSKAENEEVTVPAMVQKVLPKTPIHGTKKETYIVAVLLFMEFDFFLLTTKNFMSYCIQLLVHFGATKDALSRHFNKFGAVLKVVRKNSHESGATTVTVTGRGPGRVAHNGASFSPYMARGRAPVRGGGSRSLQWKRGGQSSDATSNAACNAAAAGSNVRSFTYTRVAPKEPGQT